MSVLSPLDDAKRPIKAAKFQNDATLEVHDGYMINILSFLVPIDHRTTDVEEITITVRMVIGRSETNAGRKDGVYLPSKPIAVYLVGGPGSDNPPTAQKAMNDFYLDKGFQILYMDYRGMGKSTILRADFLNEEKFPGSGQDGTPTLQNLTPQQQASRLALFRQDNIVRDLEAVRMSLCKFVHGHAEKWTLVGQSYGGWVSFSYLSLYPQSLHMVIVTGGIPPVGQTADAVYKNTYKTLIKACDGFYNRYPHHEANVRNMLDFIAKLGKDASGNNVGIPMPGGGILTPERFLCLGRTLGTTNGDDKVDQALEMCLADKEVGTFSQETLIKIEGWLRFEERPLYAILQEPIYTEPGMPAADWSAERIGKTLEQYWWLEQGAFHKVFSGLPEHVAYREKHFTGKRIYMSAEHIYRFHYDQYQALKPLKSAANILAQKTDWPLLFDAAQLAKNEVPISSLSYNRDMFIDWEHSENTVTKGKVKNIVVDSSEDLMHTAVKDRSGQVLPRIWSGVIQAIGEKLSRQLTDEEGKSAESLIALLEVEKK
ncbi:hypothetical protein SBRCBS47491_004809 [Sporothrix bragantina]|uniref:AB hydrolase-1 domain-containing protein n=1 Tax=Sporothrix bragantina TaxID=671064 RepID=A0ABP0BRY6_9PEZI